MGLAPQLVEEIFGIVKDLNEKEGVSFLLAEQNTNVALRFAHYGYILESGRVVMDGPAARPAREPGRQGILSRHVRRGAEILPRRALVPPPQAVAELMRDADMSHFDDLETRSGDARAADLATHLPEQIARAKGLAGYAGRLDGVDPAAITDAAALAALPVLRKSDLGKAQAANPPFGGFTARPAHGFAHVFQSPGPIYEPGGTAADWWRMGRFLHAAGIGPGDIVQNCFGYHLTPAGMIFENGARAVGAAVLPAGTGQTELQVTAARDLGVTAYAGTPDYLKVILDKADAMGVKLAITKAAVGGGALFPSLRAEYAERGITCLQMLCHRRSGQHRL